MYLDSLAELFEQQPYFCSCSEEQIIKDLKMAGFNEPKVIEHQGLIFALGTVSKT